MGGPTADMTWEGEQLAVWYDRSATRTYDDYVTECKLRDLAREMAPSRFEPPHRVATPGRWRCSTPPSTS